MPWTLSRRNIQRIVIVDDDATARRAMGWVVQDDVTVVDESGPLPPVDELVASMKSRGDALISDHHLSTRQYSSYDGAQLVAQTQRAGLPGVLCTRFVASDVDTIRPYLRNIPALRRPDELNEPDEVRIAITECVDELEGRLRVDRRPWRTQVVVERVDSVDSDVIHVEVPAWPLDETVRLRRRDLPNGGEVFREEFRCHAWVNLGAPSMELLYFVDWEVD